MSKSKKSNIKRLGIKSVLQVIDSNNDSLLYITKFDMGNEAVIDTTLPDNNYGINKVSGLKIEQSNQENIFDVEKASETKKKKIKSQEKNSTNLDLEKKRKNISGKFNDNRKTTKWKDTVRQDQIGKKSDLETEVFGEAFDNDTIHIQIAYSIFNIEKILAQTINNIIFVLNNAINVSNNNSTLEDYIGDYINPTTSFDNCLKDASRSEYKRDIDRKRGEKSKKLLKALFNYFKSGRLEYFGDFMDIDCSDVSGDVVEYLQNNSNSKFYKDFERNYTYLAILVEIRLSVFHGNNDQSKLFSTIQNDFDKEKIGYCYNLLKDRIDSLNDNFKDNALLNLYILSKALNVQNKSQLLQDYYDYIVLKEYKYIGISIKVLREIACKELGDNAKDNIYEKILSNPTEKNRLYKLVDFVIYRLLLQNEQNVNYTIANLRKIDKEDNYNKSIYYRKLYDNIKNSVKACVTCILNEMQDPTKYKKNYIKLKNENGHMISVEKQISIKDMTPFSKKIYLLTKFLDAKEINILLTYLMHEFSNIASFINVFNEIPNKKNDSIVFEEKYGLFKNSDKVEIEMRLLCNVARMHKKDDNKIPDVMYNDALRVLGYKQKEIDNIVKNLKLKENHPTRNFIINNVIKSSRFQYLIKYAYFKDYSKLNNKSLLKFVLEKMDENLINKYFDRISNENKFFTNDEKIEKLVEELLSVFNNTEIESFKQNPKTTKEQCMKEKFVALLNLYLTVLYLVIKNLINVNSRYVMAFYFLERDYATKQLTEQEKNAYLKGCKADYRKFACDYYKFAPQSELILIEEPKTKKYYIKKSYVNSDPLAIRLFRNQVAHLNVIRNLEIDENIKFKSYFELYHYHMQINIIAKYEEARNNNYFVKDTNKYYYMVNGKEEIKIEVKPELIRTYKDGIKKYKKYSKTFLKSLCFPFSYNVPRYENLSTCELFDMNDNN